MLLANSENLTPQPPPRAREGGVPKPFSRYIPTPIDRRCAPMGRRDLRALVLVASPSNLGKYQLAAFDVKAVISGVKEALIRYWPRLQKWLDEGRTNLQLREIITQAAQDWKNHKENKNDYLIQGRRLEDAEALSKQPKFLSQLEAEYVKACVELRQSQGDKFFKLTAKIEQR